MSLLRRDSRDRDAVRHLQQQLRDLRIDGYPDRWSEPSPDRDPVNLSYHPLTVDGFFGPRTEQAVLEFQERRGLLADGIVGPATSAALEVALAEQNAELTERPRPSPDPDTDTGENLLASRPATVASPADRWLDGYDRVVLREDVADAYRRVYDEAHRQGARVTSSGGMRALTARVSAARSATSLHYLGRALDLMVRSGMVDPAADPYVITRDGEAGPGRFRHRIWARCDRDLNPDADLPPERTVNGIVSYANREPHGEQRGRFLDLTALFEAEGFVAIASRPGFAAGRSWLGAEWWHLQWEQGLVRGETRFGVELLRLYDEDEVAGTPPWAYRDALFGEGWG